MAYDPFEEKAAQAIVAKTCKGKAVAAMRKLFDKVTNARMTVENLHPGGVDSRLSEECLALAEIVATGRGNGSRSLDLPVAVEQWLAKQNRDLEDDLAEAAKAAVDKVRTDSAASAIAEDMGGWPAWTSYCRGLSTRLGKPPKARKALSISPKRDSVRLVRDKGGNFESQDGKVVELRITEKDSITADDLNLIASIKSLRFLLLTNQPIRDDDLALLSPMKQLRTLFINCDTVKGPGFRKLQLTRLQSLGIPRKNANKAIANCTHLRGLKSFDLRSTDVSDGGFEPLADLPSLKAIEIDHCERIKGTGFKFFAEGSKLEDVSAVSVQFSRAGWQALLALKKLRHLGVSSASIPSGGIQRLAELKQLQTLNLGQQGLSDDDVVFLGGLRRLKSLSLNGNKAITDRTVEMLSKLPVLERLDLTYTAITGTSEVTLAGMDQLRDVSVFSTGMSRAAQRRLEKLCESRG